MFENFTNGFICIYHTCAIRMNLYELVYIYIYIYCMKIILNEKKNYSVACVFSAINPYRLTRKIERNICSTSIRIN